MAKVVVITLPSFLRRVMKAYALKSQIRAVGCELQRKGRSRNWQLTIELHKIIEVITLIEEDGEPSWLWVNKLLRQQHAHLSYEELLDIAKRNPNMSINELMVRTDCTIAQARRVIDELEDID